MGEISDGALLAMVGFGGGLILGLAARFGRFCTLGAIEDVLYAANWDRMRMWGVALGAGILLTQISVDLGLASLGTTIYATTAFSPMASIVGGLLFGYGMAISGNCGYGALSRLGGGDLRAFVVVIVLGVSAFMTMGGPLARLRVMLFPTDPLPDGAPLGAEQLSALTGAPALLIAALIAAPFLVISLWDRDFRRSRQMLWALAIAVAIVSGWVGTTFVVENSFEAVRVASHTFTAPVGETIFYLMTSSAGGLSFGVGSVAGVLAGAFFGSFRLGHFRWEACDDPRELGRQILGAAIMGFGGVTALGCSVGQGLSAFSALAVSGPVTLAAIVAGAAIGLRQLIVGLPWARRI